MDMIDFLYSTGHNFIIALTKLDKLKNSQKQARIDTLKEELSAYEGITLIPCSSQTGEGMDEIRSEIEKALTD